MTIGRKATKFVTIQVTEVEASHKDHPKTTVVAVGNSADCCSFSIGSCCPDIVGYFDHIRSCSIHNCSLTDCNFYIIQAGSHTTRRSAMDSFSRHTAMRSGNSFSSSTRTAAYFGLDLSAASSLHIGRIE